MRLIIALSAVAMPGLTSTALDSGSASTQSCSVHQTRSPISGEGESTVAARGQAGGFFGRMMEMERRKNAWLRGVFS